MAEARVGPRTWMLFALAVGALVALAILLFLGQRDAGAVDGLVDPTPVTDTAAPVVGTVETAATPVTDTVGQAAQPVTDTVGPVAQPVTDTVAPVVQPVTETVAPVVQPV